VFLERNAQPIMTERLAKNLERKLPSGIDAVKVVTVYQFLRHIFLPF
jgi:hypothetical protein